MRTQVPCSLSFASEHDHQDLTEVDLDKRKKELDAELERDLKRLTAERKESLHRLDWELAEAVEALHEETARKANERISQHREVIANLERKLQANSEAHEGSVDGSNSGSSGDEDAPGYFDNFVGLFWSGAGRNNTAGASHRSWSRSSGSGSPSPRECPTDRGLPVSLVRSPRHGQGEGDALVAASADRQAAAAAVVEQAAAAAVVEQATSRRSGSVRLPPPQPPPPAPSPFQDDVSGSVFSEVGSRKMPPHRSAQPLSASSSSFWGNQRGL